MFTAKLDENDDDNILKMCDMQTFDIGIVVESAHSSVNGDIVMRVPHIDGECNIINLTGKTSWTRYHSCVVGEFKVKLLPKGTKITLEIE